MLGTDRTLAVRLGLPLCVTACAPALDRDDTGALGPAFTDHRPNTTTRGPATWSFTGAAPSPVPFNEAGWDWRDRDTWLAPQPVNDHHRMDCGLHPGTHAVTRYEQVVCRCRDHLMTTIRAEGYRTIVLTHDRMRDWSSGDAALRFDVSTLRT